MYIYDPMLRPSGQLPPIVVVDSGGTNTRFAVSREGELVELAWMPAVDGPYDLIPHLAGYVARVRRAGITPAHICVAMGGIFTRFHSETYHYTGNNLGHAGLPDVITIAREGQAPATKIKVTWINDVTAAVPALLQEDASKSKSSDPADTLERKLILGIGTWLGSADATLLPNGQLIVAPSELGRNPAAIPRPNPIHTGRHDDLWAVIASLQAEAEPFKWERLVSGTGLATAYAVLAGQSAGSVTAHEVSLRAKVGDVVAIRSLRVLWLALQALIFSCANANFMGGVHAYGHLIREHANILVPTSGATRPKYPVEVQFDVDPYGLKPYTRVYPERRNLPFGLLGAALWGIQSIRDPKLNGQPLW